MIDEAPAAAQNTPERQGADDQGAFARTLGPGLGGVNDGRGRPAGDRLKVYRNNVIVSLSEALAAAFPVTERLMGADFFKAAAVAYAEAEKPASPLLFEYGATFADFIARLPGLASYPFVPEVARLEFARIAATHAADAAPLAADTLAAIPPEALAGATFAAHPATRLVATPRGGLSAWRTNREPPEAPVEAAAALVTRPAFSVAVAPLDAPAAAFVAALLDGRPLGEAGAEEGLDLGAALGVLLTTGALASVSV